MPNTTPNTVPNNTGTTTRSTPSRPIFARFWVRVGPSMDRGGLADRRADLLAGLSGRVIEVGAGNGLNFPHYPPEVTAVVAIEPDPHLRGLAHDAADQTAVPIKVVDGVAGQLPGADAAFDAAVASMVLCSVPDLQQALAEIRRVVRPGGQLRFLEHVRAETPMRRNLQRLLDATIWPTLFGGCHTARDTIGVIESAGFTIEHQECFRFPEAPVPQPAYPYVVAAATRR
jgi:ubiquinone/menaquinone biosynthesis C-methylase UbiE